MSFELICYLNFGYPSIEAGLHYADLYIRGGCRVLQLDIPSRDPFLENEMIQKRMAHCLEQYPDYETYFEGISAICKKHPDVRIVLMLYENIVEELGVRRIIDFCTQNKIQDLTYVGASRGDLKQELIAAGLCIACYVRFHLPEEEITFARSSNGMVLFQAKPEGRFRPGCETFADGVRYLRERGITQPIYATVGIRTPEDVRAVRAGGADGAYVGSTLILALEDDNRLLDTMARFQACAT